MGKTDTISRQAAIDALHMHIMYRMGTDSNKKRLDEWINNLPSVQPEIIRCKDCKHWREGTAFSYCDKLYGMGVLDALDYMVAEDDFCSRAERREE